MSFNYSTPPAAAQTTSTYESKPLLCKSFKVDIAAGSPFTTATTYTLGTLPKGAQVMWAVYMVPTAVSGGTVSGATIVVQAGGYTLINGASVFSPIVASMASNNYYANLNLATNKDQLVTITPTLTGSGATAGIIYIHIFYVA